MITASAGLVGAIVLIIIFVAALLGFIITSYVKLTDKYTRLQKRIQDEEANRSKIIDEIVQNSYREGQGFIVEAKRKAQNLIKDAQFFKDSKESEFQKALDQITSHQLEIYQNTLKDVREDTQVVFDKLLVETKKQKDEKADELMLYLRDQVDESIQKYKNDISNLTKTLQTSLESEHGRVKDELDQYKAMMMDHLDDSIVDVVKEVVSEVVSTGLSLEERQDMIIQSLDQAKSKFGLSSGEDGSKETKVGEKTLEY